MPPGEGTKEVEELEENRSPCMTPKQAATDKKEIVADTTVAPLQLPSFRKDTSKPYTLGEFSRLWCDAETTVGETELLEKERSFLKKKRSTEQYGRILARGMRVSTGGQVAVPLQPCSRFLTNLHCRPYFGKLCVCGKTVYSWTSAMVLEICESTNTYS